MCWSLEWNLGKLTATVSSYMVKKYASPHNDGKRGVKVQLHFSLTLTLEGGEWLASLPGQFTPGKESQTPEPFWTFYADVVSWLGVGDRVIQTASWCYEDHTCGTQLLVVLKKPQLNLIDLINTTIHPSVSLWQPCHSTKMIHIPPNKDLSLALE